uniref:G-protein coupled receptors family 3 profile domain-containing protein n=1 Tax=Xenopus tropicalis TaxID=8364 RepID=A0A803KFB4_XENTR
MKISYCNEKGCMIGMKELRGMSQPGDIVIGAVVPVHVDKMYPATIFTETPSSAICKTFRFENYQRIQALRFAVEEINKDPDLLPNITIGYQILDSCTVLQRALSGTLQLLTGHKEPVPNYRCQQAMPLAAIIGHSISTYSMMLAHILGLYRYPQLLHYMKQVRLKTGSGTEFAFHENGDPTAVYDIINWQFSPLGKIQQVKVGSYDTGATAGDIFTVNISALHWSTGQKEVPRSICSQSCPPGYSKAVLPGKPVCCFECFPCPHGEISNKTDSPYCFKCPWDMWPNIKRDSCLPKPREFFSYEDSLGETLATTSISSSLVPFAILVLFVHYKMTPIVRANNYLLSCLLLVSLSLCFLCSLFFIGYPHPEMCRLRQVTFGMVFALCISCILAKTFMVVVAFKATKPNSSLKKWTRPRISYLIVVLCILIQTCLCTMWLLLSPPFFEENIRTKVGVVIVECNDGSSVAFWCMLGYLGLLASVSFFVAFLARRLPDSFNEAKFITFSMGTFLSVWISFIPATMSARGKYTVAMEIFAILSSTWALVVCMFLPKCFIILFRPNMNSREHLMGKEKRRSEKQACKQNNTSGRH